jgi:CheY-like chemotaxis protein
MERVMPVLMGRSRPGVVLDKPVATAWSQQPDDVAKTWTGSYRIDDIRVRRGPLRVLVIDDNRDAADSLSILVKMWGHHASVAYDGAAALAMATDELLDVLFMDIGMPKMDGFRLARHLRCQRRFADTLLVAITGWADQVHRRLWAEAFDHYLIKPVDPPSLECLLLDRSRLVRSRIGIPASGLVAAGITGRSSTALAL